MFLPTFEKLASEAQSLRPLLEVADKEVAENANAKLDAYQLASMVSGFDEGTALRALEELRKRDVLERVEGVVCEACGQWQKLAKNAHDCNQCEEPLAKSKKEPRFQLSTKGKAEHGAATAGLGTSRWSNDIADYKGKVHYAVITVRPFEEDAFLERFPEEHTVKGERTYRLCRVQHRSGARVLVAEVRMQDMGNIESSGLTKEILGDLDPAWILLVGIAGASPFSEAVLGDVVFSTKVSDVNTRASTASGGTEFYAPGGGYMERVVSDTVIDLRKKLAEAARAVTPLPVLDLKNVRYTTNDADVNKKILGQLKARFAEETYQTKNFDGAIVSSDENVKDVERVNDWQKFLKGALAIEMELAGVYRSSRTAKHTYPILSIRGISDIVGLAKQEGWVNYAAGVAAEYAHTFVAIAPIPATRR